MIWLFTATAAGQGIADHTVYWRFDDDLVRHVAKEVTAQSQPGRRLMLHAEPGAGAFSCEATLDDVALEVLVVGEDSCLVVHPPHMPRGELAATARWTVVGAELDGSVALRHPSEHLGASRLVITGAELAVTVVGEAEESRIDGGFEVEATDLAPATALGIDDPVVHWRVVQHGETEIFVDKAAALNLVARRAVMASMPEPAIPVGMKGQGESLEVVGDLITHLRTQVVPGAVPGWDPLDPRPLLAARKSRWATDWEMALILARYLGQLRMDAVPMPVRAQHRGKPDFASPAGFSDGAVVRLRLDGDETWLDPGCMTCAPGELSLELWGGWVLDRDTTVLPSSPGGEAVRRYLLTARTDGSLGGRLEVAWEGVQATRMRERLRDVAIDDRVEWLLQALGAAGATLASVDGLSEGRMTVVVDDIVVSDPLALSLEMPDVAPEGEPLVLLHGPGRQRLRVEVRGLSAAAREAAVDGDGLAWERSVDVEQDGYVLEEVLTVSQPRLKREDVVVFVTEVTQSRR